MNNTELHKAFLDGQRETNRRLGVLENFINGTSGITARLVKCETKQKASSVFWRSYFLPLVLAVTVALIARFGKW